MTSNEILAKMLDWIFVNTDSKKNVDVARKAGLDAVTISRILNGRVKKAKQETLRAVNAAYGNVFNPEWLRGKSDVMLVADLAHATTEVNTASQQPEPVLAPDYHTMLRFNSQIAAKDEIIAAKDDRIADLLRQLAGMEETMKRELADKDAIIEVKEKYINLLERQIAELRSEKGLPGGFPFHGVAEDQTAPMV